MKINALPYGIFRIKKALTETSLDDNILQRTSLKSDRISTISPSFMYFVMTTNDRLCDF